MAPSHTKGGSPVRPYDTETPPAYTPVAGSQAGNNTELPPGAIDDLNAAFSSLDLPVVAVGLHRGTCLAHLKLLAAFEALKEDIGYADGLWEIFDSRATTPLGDASEKDADPKQKLAQLREKRWALYVARAVDRYEAWWDAMVGEPLTEEDMKDPAGPNYIGFVNSRDPMKWEVLPPLDVLMVWHAHMLNPRAFLEDCIRFGMAPLWTAGMPWRLVNDAIDTGFNYRPGDESVQAWENITGRPWDNVEDSLTKEIKCPACNAPDDVLWTTCGMPEDSKDPSPGLVGHGYGDGDFVYVCQKCSLTLNRGTLELSKFVKDVEALLLRNRPMPGTILDSMKGVPQLLPRTATARATHEQTFPNVLIKEHLRSQVLDLLQPDKARALQPSMEHVRVLIEETLKDQATMKRIQGLSGSRRFRATTRERVAIRKMMSRYWGNHTPFALELSGAVLRQGIFSEKMQKIDWLHSPAAMDTMERLVTKYRRFIDIMASNPSQMAVPTLDVDLAWHTHQLSPQSYYGSTVTKASKFIDHDDKVSEVKLNTAFEWTSKTYQEKYNEVYSECTCWYCESIRASHVSSMGKLLGVSTNEKISDKFHSSGKAGECPPDQSAHISSHNAVQFIISDSLQDQVMKSRRDRQLQRLEEGYKKAQKRAEKKGRTLPPRDEYYNSWGYPYLMYGPWIYPMYFTPGIYYAGDPCNVTSGSGTPGACAAGTCGGGTASGGCAGAVAGACGSAGGCSGTGACASAGGCGGGGGAGGSGGCSGGGGGGCGGGGGGGGGCGGGGGGGC